MSKLISISIDVTKIPRDKIIAHKNGGKYVSLDVWINDEPDKFDKDCSVNVSQTKDEREAKEKKTYCGNGNKRFGWEPSQPPQDAHNTAKANAYQPQDDGDDIPF